MDYRDDYKALVPLKKKDDNKRKKSAFTSSWREREPSSHDLLDEMM